MDINQGYLLLSFVLLVNVLRDSYTVTDGWTNRPSFRSTGVRLDGFWLRLHLVYIAAITGVTVLAPWVVGIHKGISLAIGTVVESLEKHTQVPVWLLKTQLFFGFDPQKDPNSIK